MSCIRQSGKAVDYCGRASPNCNALSWCICAWQPSPVFRRRLAERIPGSAAMTDEVMKVEEVAAFLRVSPWTIRHWCCQRKIPFHRVGRSIRFHKTEIERFFKQKLHDLVTLCPVEYG